MISLVWPQDRQVAEEALAQMGIADKIHERTSHLSGGEQQRVAIARLMVQGSRVILADEPVSSLDPVRADDIVGDFDGFGRWLRQDPYRQYPLAQFDAQTLYPGHWSAGRTAGV